MAEGNGQPLEPWFLELLADIRLAHEYALETGGVAGEHAARLLGAVGRAFQTAHGKPIFETDLEKAAALFHGIICDHAFVDGNKRTAVLVVFYFLIGRGRLREKAHRVHVRLVGEIAVETAMGSLDVREVAIWFERILGPIMNDRE